MTAHLSEKVLEGFRTVALTTAALEVRVAPQLGARIVSLRDLRTGREWLWPGAGMFPRIIPRLGDSFERSGHGGIDECLPTIGACAWKRRALPDHGEVWTQPWTLDEAALTRGEIRTSLVLPLSPLALTRTIRANGSEVRFEYELTSLSEEPEEFLWSWHPLFGLRPGDRLDLPAGASEMRLEVAVGAHTGERGEFWLLPRPHAGVDLLSLDLAGANACVKGFIGPLSAGETAVALRGADGSALELMWNAEENPFLGLWLARGYRGWHHIALEPTCGAPDRLDLAVESWRHHSTLAPRAGRCWAVRMRLGL